MVYSRYKYISMYYNIKAVTCGSNKNQNTKVTFIFVCSFLLWEEQNTKHKMTFFPSARSFCGRRNNKKN